MCSQQLQPDSLFFSTVGLIESSVKYFKDSIEVLQFGIWKSRFYLHKSSCMNHTDTHNVLSRCNKLYSLIYVLLYFISFLQWPLPINRHRELKQFPTLSEITRLCRIDVIQFKINDCLIRFSGPVLVQYWPKFQDRVIPI